MKLCEIGVFPNIKHQTSEAWQFEVAKSDPDLICRHRTFDLYLCLLSHNQTPKHGSPQAQCTYPEPWAKFDSGHIMSYQRHSAQIIPYKTGWWFQPLRKILFNWDDYSQYMGKKNVPNHQPEKHKMAQTCTLFWAWSASKVKKWPVWNTPL